MLDGQQELSSGLDSSEAPAEPGAPCGRAGVEWAPLPTTGGLGFGGRSMGPGGEPGRPGLWFLGVSWR